MTDGFFRPPSHQEYIDYATSKETIDACVAHDLLVLGIETFLQEDGLNYNIYKWIFDASGPYENWTEHCRRVAKSAHPFLDEAHAENPNYRFEFVIVNQARFDSL